MPVAEDGSVCIEGLPWGVRIRLMVQSPVGPPLLSDEMVLDRLEARCVFHVAPSRELRGRVVDDAGRAVGGATLTARAGGTSLVLKSTTWLLPGAAYVQDAVMVDSAEDGSFALPMWWGESRPGLVTVEAAGFVGLEYPTPVGVGLPDRLVLYEAGRGGPPGFLLQGDSLPEFVHVSIRQDGAQRGPFPWDTGQEFELPLRRAALVEVVTRVDEGPSHAQAVFADGRRRVEIPR